MKMLGVLKDKLNLIRQVQMVDDVKWFVKFQCSEILQRVWWLVVPKSCRRSRSVYSIDNTVVNTINTLLQLQSHIYQVTVAVSLCEGWHNLHFKAKKFFTFSSSVSPRVIQNGSVTAGPVGLRRKPATQTCYSRCSINTRQSRRIYKSWNQKCFKEPSHRCSTHPRRYPSTFGRAVLRIVYEKSILCYQKRTDQNAHQVQNCEDQKVQVLYAIPHPTGLINGYKSSS